MMVALDILIMVFALAFFFWHAAQQHDRDEAAPSAARSALLDGELALHAAFAVAGDGAEEGVLAGLEVDLDGGDAAVLDDRRPSR